MTIKLHRHGLLSWACASLALASASLLSAAPVTLVDPSFEDAAPTSTLGSTNPGADGGWWMNPAIHAGGSVGLIYVADNGADDGDQTLLVGYANQLRGIEQTVSTPFSAGSDYTLTVFGRSIGAGGSSLLRLEFFRGDTGVRIGSAANHTIVTGADRDVSVTINAGDILLANAAGRNIGVRIVKDDLLGTNSELRVDHVRVEESATNLAAELLMQQSGNLVAWAPIERRFLTQEEAQLEYRLQIGEISSVILKDPGFESQSSGTQFPTTDPGTGGGWWRNTAISPGGNDGMIYVNDASAGDGGARVALLGFPPELRSLQQTVATTFVADVDYTLTAYARAVAYSTFADNEQVDFTITLFNGTTGAVIKEQTFVVVKNITGPAGDKSFTATAAEIASAGAVGAPIGIRLNKSALYPPVGSSTDGRIELRVDNVRLTHTPLPGVLGVRTETSPEMLDWMQVGQRQVPIGQTPQFFRLRINPLPIP